jgi:hypothetical protein
MIFMNHTISPAYGRDYKSAAAAKKDWINGKDFRMEPEGCYTSIRDWKSTDCLELRYARLTKLVFVGGQKS